MKKRLTAWLLACCLLLPLTAMARADAVLIEDASDESALRYADPVIADKLGDVLTGHIGLYADRDCTREVLAPLGCSVVRPGSVYYVKEQSTGQVYGGYSCWIYANCVYNTLFGDVPNKGNGPWDSSEKVASNENGISYASFLEWGVRPGSLLRSTGNASGSYNANLGHSIIVIGYTEEYIACLEGNANSKGLVRLTVRDWDNMNEVLFTNRGYRLAFIISPKADVLPYTFRQTAEGYLGYFRYQNIYRAFKDVKQSDWFYSGVKEAYKLGLMNGVGEERFNPGGLLTVGEATVMAARFLSLYWDDQWDFSSGGEWFEPYLVYLSEWGIEIEREHIGEIITRAEFARLMYLAFPADVLDELREYVPFDDVEEDDPFLPYIEALYGAAIMEGNAGLFRPDDPLMRSEAATIMVRGAKPTLRNVN